MDTPSNTQADSGSGELAPRGGSGEMFDRIAANYDRLNRLISFGLDRGWRRKLIRALEVSSGGRVLDVATGTADVAIDAARAVDGLRVTGLDPSVGMLEVGRRKLRDGGLDDRIDLVVGDAQAMAFEDGAFDAACISFGIRNVPDRTLGLSEMRRVVRPGGKVVVLELGEPRRGITAPFARFHIHHVVPRLGALLSGDREYRYLAQSIRAFPEPEAFLGLMREAGLMDVRVEPLFFGVAHLYVGTVPAA